MSDYHEIYEKLPNDILDTDDDFAKKYVYNLVNAAGLEQERKPDAMGNSISLTKFMKRKPVTNLCRKKSRITRKEKRKLNLLKCPKIGWNYNEFEPLRKIWTQHMKQYLNYKETAEKKEQGDWYNFNCNLSKADYHGAEMKVVRSKCPSLVGISGTCILDTKNTFKLVSKDNKCKTVPKNNSVFQIQCSNISLTVYGKYIKIRPADRSSKKIKTVMIPDL